MSKINILTQDIISKVAAGEVVERPASVVKELIENSLDAGARNIRIDVEDAGLKIIKVSDDGEGMSYEDLRLSFLPHATSKLAFVEDLASIRTLGFRGEALASICAVSKFRIRSRSLTSDFGHELTLLHGEVVSEEKKAMLPGTTVTVSSLFFNVPARSKFLKSSATEYSQILKLVSAQALANPTVGWEFYRDGKIVFQIRSDMPLDKRIRILLGADLLSNLLAIQFTSEHLSLTGFISKPQAGEFSKDTQYLFVNNRHVNSPLVSDAVKAAYGSLLEDRRFPPFILYLSVRPDLVDVNVHPRKEHVSFWNDATVHEFIAGSVKECLSKYDLTYKTSAENADALHDSASAHTFYALKDLVKPWNVKGISEEPFSEIVQIGETYLVSPIKQGFLVVDQHAAHESILFEEYTAGFLTERSRNEKLILKDPLVVSIPLADAEIVKDSLPVFFHIGFDVEGFGGGTFKISGVPKLLQDHDLNSLFKEVIADLKSFGKLRTFDDRSKRTIEFLACRGAIKAGEKLSFEERRNLLTKLATSKGLYTCPHGRPVSVVMSLHDLDRLFKRI